MYDFSLPGGEKITLSDLIEVLGILGDTYSGEKAAFDSVEDFLKEVANVEFSDESLVKVAKNEEDNDWTLESLQPFETEESLTITMKNGDVVTVKVTDDQIKTEYLSDSGELYEVTVTYGEAAGIPDGSTLKVTEFSEDDAEYEYARNSILADKKARGEWVDLSSFGLAALDISILNPDGEEIEPEAPVQVDIKVKRLPGVEDLAEIKDTLEVQHHVEVANGVVIETVFDGSLDANFLLQTDETIAEEGTTVDPSSVSDDAFNIPNIDLDSLIDLGEHSSDDDDIISFETPVFSVFTLTWKTNRINSNNTVNLSWKSGTGRNATTYGTVRIHYYDTDYNPIQPPVSDQTVTQQQTISLTSGNYVNIPGYTFSSAWVYYDQQAGTGWNLDEVGVQFYNYNYYGTTYRFTGIQHGGQEYKSGYYQNNQAYTEDVYLFFENTGTQTQSGKVHYGYINGSTFVEFPEGTPSYTPTYSNQYQKYLIYDVDGYQYSYTYRNRSTNRIAPYVSVSGSYYDTAGSYLGQLSNNDDIYLVYEPNPSTTQGGTPKLKDVSAEDKPDVPDITKTSVVNGDGTNTLSLSITGHTKPREVEKLADVIVIFDVSGSMKQNIDNKEDAADGVNDTNSRMYQLKQAVNTLADTLLSDKYKNSQGESLIRMSLISFSNIAQTSGNSFTEDADTFKSWVSGLGADGGTNWEAALKLANTIQVDPERATFVIFVTDGEPTFRYTRGKYSDLQLIYPQSNSEYDITDYYSIYNVFGGGNQDLYGENYAAALIQAKSIVGNKKNLFTIGIGPDVISLERFGNEAGAGGNYTATSSSALEDAFDDITAKIVALMGYSDVKITDGITDLTQTVQKSTYVNFAEDDFTYYKGHAATVEDVTNELAAAEGDMVWEAWTPSSEGCAEAVYNTTTGAVEWNMGEAFMLEDGYTYQVRFKVWPSQEAYDLLADLNNGVKSYASLSDEEKAQIKEPTTAGGMYTLKTNSETSYTYREATKSGDTVTPTGEPSEPGHFDDVDPLLLTTKPLRVQKQWHNNYVDSRALTDSITMELYGVDSDGVTSRDFKTITLTNAGNWYSENNYISYGLVTYDTETGANVKIYETGHDFTLRETDDEAHYYELTAGIYRPMFINGTPAILEKVDAAPAGMGSSAFHYSDGSHHYYRLDGKIYRDTQSDILMIATNTHRSYMDLNKVVVDESGIATVDDTEFEYNITFTVPSGIANYDTVEKYIWFSIYDSVARRTLSPDEYSYTNAQKPADIDSSTYGGSAYANYLIATSGNQFTLKIKQGWNVRFLNLPIGTTYSFEETSIPDGYDFVKAEVSGTRWIANMVDGTDQGSEQTMTSLPANNSADNSNTGISGTIDFANARYNTTYTNKTIPVPVKILKTSQDGTTPLKDAVFTLHTENGYKADPKQAAKTDLTSGADGIIDLGNLSFGMYYLVETAAPAGYIPLSEPVEITVTSSGVTYNQSDSSLSHSGGGVKRDETTGAYTLIVTNNAGYELPSTGGPGTRLFTILGSILILGAGVLLWRRRRLI
ncbi:MAG: VWA domain-containing protein [Oscillospiraceae bacterium]|nr:VWA domain-containing protein [Oscillospiraceae bacterium]